MNTYTSYPTNHTTNMSADMPGLAPSPLTPSVLSSMASELMTHNNHNNNNPGAHQGLGAGGQGLGSAGFNYAPPSAGPASAYPNFSRSSVPQPQSSQLSSHDAGPSQGQGQGQGQSHSSSLPPTPVPPAGGNISQAMVASAVVQVTPFITKAPIYTL